MELVIHELKESNLKDTGQCDGQFAIESELVLQADNNRIRYTVIDRPARTKRYDGEEVDYPSFINNPKKTVFLAYVGEQVAGQIILRKYWNNYAHVQDIVVDINFRRLGVGRALIDQAKKWALEKQLPGIMLETQNNNVPACRFYEANGFKLGGFDNNLYKGLKDDTDEVALYWYFFFEE